MQVWVVTSKYGEPTKAFPTAEKAYDYIRNYFHEVNNLNESRREIWQKVLAAQYKAYAPMGLKFGAGWLKCELVNLETEQ